MSSLRIATLNIWNKSGPWVERVVLIRRELQRLSASVVGLQEVLRFAPEGQERFQPRADNCQASEIAAGLGYEIAYASVNDPVKGLQFGNALLSRHPVLETWRFPLPSLDSGESRTLLGASLQTAYGVLPVFVTHLNWKLHHGAVRLAQVQFIAKRIRELAPSDGPTLPPVLMGDFNAEPDSDEMRYLRGLKVEAGESVFFADAWLYGGDESPGATFSRSNDYAQRSHQLSRRIDYIYVRGPDSLLRGEPIHTEVAFATAETRAGQRVWASDHFGVVTDIHFAPRSP